MYLQEELDLLPFQDVSIGDQQQASQCLVTAKPKSRGGERGVRGAFVVWITLTRDYALRWGLI